MPIPVNGKALPWKKLCFLMPARLDSFELVPCSILKRKNKICLLQPAPVNVESVLRYPFLFSGTYFI